jgi:hypothetical protein
MSVPAVLVPSPLPTDSLGQPPVSPDVQTTFHADETLFFVDWDDTLLPTTYLAANNLREDCEVIPIWFAEQLSSYAEVVKTTLDAMRRRGRVIIVTNAETGWIDMTCSKFLPSLVATLSEVESVSARSTFEPLGFQNPSQWKEQMFAEKINLFFANTSKSRQNVLSMGDASHEREAIHKVARTLGCMAKSLKFMERPDIAHLRQEHELIQTFLDQIVQHTQNLDLCVHEL